MKIPSAQYKIICDEFLNKRIQIQELSKKYGVCYGTINSILSKLKCRRRFRRNFFNENYFDVIDSEDKAYFLGLLYADGCNNTTHASISLQEGDANSIREFGKYINYTGKYHFFDNSKREYRKGSVYKNIYYINLHSRHLCDSLYRLGCVPRKSLILKFPNKKQVPEKFLVHFIRGYFDGDGCVTVSKRAVNEVVISSHVTSTFIFLKSLNKYLKKQIEINNCVYLNKKRNPLTGQFSLSSRRAIVFLHFIYKNSNIKMTRKFNKFIEFLKQYNPSSGHDTYAKISAKKMIEIKNYWLNKVNPILDH